MSSASENNLKLLCTEENKIRDTYYGSVFRANFSINGEKGDWDILQISIPFSPMKEAELMRRFGIDREDLPAFYASFEKAVVRHSTLIKELNATEQDSIRRSIVEYKTVKYYPRMSRDGTQIGQDFYFITVPMESFVGTDIFREQGACLTDINNLAIRLLQNAKVFSEAGFTIGAVDLDSCYYADADGKKYLKLGYSFYGTGPDTVPDTYTQDMTPFVSDKITSGTEKQSLDSDVRMICAYIWTILDGHHYTEPNTNAWIAANFYSVADDFPQNLAPAYAPRQLTDLLVEGMIRGADSMKTLQMGIRAVNKAIAANELENTFIVFSEPEYLSAPLPELREETEEEEPEPDSKQPAGNQNGKGRKKKARKGGIAVVILAAAVLLGTAAYFVIGPEVILGIFGTAELPMSASVGLYESGGKVLNADATENLRYAIDEEGNMIAAGNPEQVLFLKEQVSPFIYVEDLKIAITGKKFDRYHGADDAERILRDYVVDLRGIENLTYDSYLGEDNRIPDRIIEEYGITDETLILMKDSMYPDTGYKVAMLVKKEPDEPAAEEEPDETNLEEPVPDPEPEMVPDTAEEISGDEEPPEESSAVRAVTGVSEDALFLVQGEWTYTLSLSMLPDNAVDRKVALSCEDTEYMYFVVENKDGQKSKARTVKMSVREGEDTEITAVGLVEGKYIIRIESDDGALSKKTALTFEPAAASSTELPPQPTPTPKPTPAPTPTPTPEATPVPTPTPYTPYYGGGGYSDGGYSYAPEPTPTPMPVATPTPAPAPTPEQNLPLSCSIDHLDLTVGETFRLGDCLDGVENFALLICRVSEEGVVFISPAEGFLITAAAEGETVIRISKGEESVEVSVCVSDM